MGGVGPVEHLDNADARGCFSRELLQLLYREESERFGYSILRRKKLTVSGHLRGIAARTTLCCFFIVAFAAACATSSDVTGPGAPGPAGGSSGSTAPLIRIAAVSPGTTFDLPSTTFAQFVVTSAASNDLSATDALTLAQQSNPNLQLPPDAVAMRGVLTDGSGEAAKFEQLPVWAFRYHGCEVPPANVTPTNSLCTRWVFLDSQTGQFVEARYSP